MLGMTKVKLVDAPVSHVGDAIYIHAKFYTLDGNNRIITDRLTLQHPERSQDVAISVRKMELVEEYASPDLTLFVGTDEHGTVDRYGSLSGRYTIIKPF
jgi:hypothetical protein